MGCRTSGAPAASLEFGLMAQGGISPLERMGRSSQERAECRLRSMLRGTCPNPAFPNHSVGKAETPYSRWLGEISYRLCSCGKTATRMLSWSRAADALSLFSNPTWRALVPFGVRPMTKDLMDYRQLERRLWMVRWRHDGEESSEEDAILDEMEKKWMSLTDAEQAALRLEGPRCWPTDSSSLPPRLSDSLYPSVPTPWAYEGFHSPSEAILSTDMA